MGASEQLRRFKRKARIWSINPNCHWCNTPTVLISPILRNRLPDNAATLDHLYSRSDPRRRYVSGKSLSDTVICCNKCNFLRSKIQYRLAQGKIGLAYADLLLSQVGGG